MIASMSSKYGTLSARRQSHVDGVGAFVELLINSAMPAFAVRRARRTKR
jgi:hypothetical protein